MKAFESLGYRGQVHRLRRLAEVALQDYDVQPTRLKLLAHMGNTTLRVTAGDQHYVLRIHRPGDAPGNGAHDVAAVRSEMEWLAAIRRDTDLVVSEPVPRRGGGFVTVVESDGVPGPRVCGLFRWIDGRFSEKGLTARHLSRVGQFTAQLHEQARAFVPGPGFSRPRVAEVTDDAVAHAVAEVGGTIGSGAVPTVIAAYQHAREAQARLGEDADTFGLIHGDLHQENFLFHRGEVRAIDFDNCGWEYFLYDLAVILGELSYMPTYPLALRDALLHGYRAVREVPEAHERLLEPLIALRHLQTALWFIGQREHPGFPGWEDEARGLLEAVADRTASHVP